MPDWIPAVVMGGLLLLVAGGLAWFQRAAWKKAIAGLAEADDIHQRATRQLRRRLQVSGLLAVIGLLIPIGDLAPNMRRSPTMFAIFWLVVLGLVVWMVLLALGDLASNLAQHRVAKNHLEVERRSLEQQLRRHRAAGNGPAQEINEG